VPQNEVEVRGRPKIPSVHQWIHIARTCAITT
jgi:hypothetical protein